MYHAPTNVVVKYTNAEFSTCQFCYSEISRYSDEFDNLWSKWCLNEDWGSPTCLAKKGNN